MTNPSHSAHIAVFYESKKERDQIIASYINEGLRRGHFCVYATVHYRDAGHMEEFSNLISNYEENVEKENVLVVDLAPFYISAMLGDIGLFEDARKMFVEKSQNRIDKHVRFVGDGTGFLFANKHFDECTMVEEWWQKKPFEGTYLCPFSKQSLTAFPYDKYAKRAILSTHDSIIDSSGSVVDGNQKHFQHLHSYRRIQKQNDEEHIKGGTA